MSLSRRKFLQRTSVAALLAGCPLSLPALAAGKGSARASAAAAAPRGTQADPLRSFTIESFLPHLNTPFRVGQGAGPTAALRLVKVTDRRPKGADGGAPSGPDCFSLLFRGSHAQPLTQETHAFSHRALGDFSMLLVPTISKDHGARYYEAIFNRRRG